MVHDRFKSFFEKTPAIHYIKQIETVEIEGVIVDVKNILRRLYACDGAHCLAVKSLSNHLSDYGFTFYNEFAAYGDCCRGPVVFISQDERERIASHLDGILPHMSQESQFIVQDLLRQNGRDCKAEAFAETAQGALGERQGQALDFAKIHTIWGDQCIFRTLHHDGSQGQVRCAIHAYAVQSGQSYLEIKPIDCWFWPLALVPLYTGQYLLTVHTEETRQFTEESENYAKKRCLTEPIPGSPYIYQSFERELIYVFGQRWYDRLVACARQYHREST